MCQAEYRKKVRQIIAQHVSRDRDRVLAVAGAFECFHHRVFEVHDPNVEATGVVIGKIALDLLDDLGVVRSAFIEPKYRRRI